MDGEGTGGCERSLVVMAGICEVFASLFHQLVHILGNFIIGHFGIALRGPDAVSYTHLSATTL